MDDLFSQGVDQASIDQLKKKLQEGGIPQSKLDNIVKVLEEQLPSTAPEAPEAPAQPEQPDTTIPSFEDVPKDEIVKEVLKPNKQLNKASLRVCAHDVLCIEDQIEDIVEEFMNSGVDPDLARQAAEELVLGEKNMVYSQRERKGPAKDVATYQDTVYERIVQAISYLEEAVDIAPKEESVTSEAIRLENKIQPLQELIDDISTHLGNAKDNPEDVEELEQADALLGALDEKIWELKRDISNIADYELELPDVESPVRFLNELADEVKQVGLDTQTGSVSPIDLGDWLY